MPSNLSVSLSTWPVSSPEYKVAQAAAAAAGESNGQVSLLDLDYFEANTPLPTGASPANVDVMRKQIISEFGTGGGQVDAHVQKMIQLANLAGATDQLGPLNELAAVQQAYSGSGLASYPNGKMATNGMHFWYYPDGSMASNGSTNWYWPNGSFAAIGNNWYYPNGSPA
jgi:hypothetical protein